MPQDCTSIRLGSAHPACLFPVFILPDITELLMRRDIVPNDGAVFSNSFPTTGSGR